MTLGDTMWRGSMVTESEMVMALAPYAVWALLFTMTARSGSPLLVSLGCFVLARLALHLFVVYSVSVAVLSRIFPSSSSAA